MARRRILVCGATGFIGRNLVESLARNPDVELHALRFTRPAYDLNGVNWHQADLRDVGAVNRLLAGMDVVIQAAATTSGARDIVKTPYIHVTDNAVMNSLLLRACFDHKVKHFVFFSCSVMYQPRESPWREDRLEIVASSLARLSEQQQLRSVESAAMRLVSGEDRLDLKLSEPLDWSSNARWRARSRLTRVTRRTVSSGPACARGRRCTRHPGRSRWSS